MKKGEGMPELTPLTDLEKSIVKQLGKARFPPATASKRFAVGLLNGNVTKLSDKGRRFLAYVVHRFRRQYTLSPQQQEWVREWNIPIEGDMKKHYTKRTVEASAYCPICNKMTQHAVLGGLLAGCLHMAEHPQPEREKAVEDKQQDLFGYHA